jgi:hypothetical protein
MIFVTPSKKTFEIGVIRSKTAKMKRVDKKDTIGVAADG